VHLLTAAAVYCKHTCVFSVPLIHAIATAATAFAASAAERSALAAGMRAHKPNSRIAGYHLQQQQQQQRLAATNVATISSSLPKGPLHDPSLLKFIPAQLAL
jgi:hypothetical protein